MAVPVSVLRARGVHTVYYQARSTPGLGLGLLPGTEYPGVRVRVRVRPLSLTLPLCTPSTTSSSR